jgi:cell division control protein 6
MSPSPDSRLDALFSRNSVFKQLNVLDTRYIPETIIGRDEQLDEVSANVQSIIDNYAPSNMWLTGPPGTGKTLVIRYIMDYLQKRAKFQYAYVIATGSPHPLIRNITLQCGCRLPVGYMRSISDMRGYFEFWLEKNQSNAIIVVDEVDLLIDSNAEQLYDSLARTPHVCVIGISNKESSILKIENIKLDSSLQPIPVRFPPYTQHELEDILAHRASLAFKENVMDPILVKQFAAIAYQHGGDARFGLALLKEGGMLANMAQRGAITHKDLDEAERKLDRESIIIPLLFLPNVEKKLLYLLLKHGETERLRLYEWYKKFSQEHYGRVYSHSTIRSHLTRLEAQNYIVGWPVGRGRARGIKNMVKASEEVPKEDAIEALEKYLGLSE